MRARPALLFALALAPFALPLVAHAVVIPFFGPIVPESAQTCAAGWGSVLEVVNRIIAFSITIGIVFVAPLLIAYAGFLYVVNPVSPASRSNANAILLNTIVGIVIALAAWLIVNALLTALTTRGGVAEWTKEMFKNSGDPCILSGTQLTNLDQAPQTGFGTGGGAAEALSCETGSELVGSRCSNSDSGEYTLPRGSSCPTGGTFDSATGDCSVCTADGCSTVAPTGPTGDAGRDIPLSSSGTAGCDASIVSQAATDGGYPLTNSQASTLACISQGEDACGSGPVTNYKWGRGSSAAGAYQITLQSHSNCFDNPVCQKVVGVTSSLNCKSGFTGGNPIPGSTVVDTCLRAAANVECSAAAAACLVKANPSFSDWAPYSSLNAACVAKFR